MHGRMCMTSRSARRFPCNFSLCYPKFPLKEFSQFCPAVWLTSIVNIYMSEEFILYRYACVQNIYFVVHQVRTKMFLL